MIAFVAALNGCATGFPGPPLDRNVLPADYRLFEIASARNESGVVLPAAVIEELSQRLRAELLQRGFSAADGAGAAGDTVSLRISLMTFDMAASERPESQSETGNELAAKVVAVDRRSGRELADFAVSVTDEPPVQGAADSRTESRLIESAAAGLAEGLADLFMPSSAAGPKAPDRLGSFAVRGTSFRHAGKGLFTAVSPSQSTIDLKQIRHSYDLAVDTDVMPFTNVTLNDVVPRLVDGDGRDYALITLYNIDPPLDDLPSREPGIDRGADFRDPANLVKSAYSNYVSPVFTLDADGRRRPVPGHPIGHFLVKLQLAGYPTVLTGMTTTKRADDELANLTLGRQLGIGGVLLTPQPGRLNTAAEALEELARRQRRLVVTDGRYYRNVGGKNVGPTYVIEDGNVVFARFKLPAANARDALQFFLEYVQRGTHNTFGSLVNRPHKGTGAGCSAFALAWLKASGVIPFVDESELRDTTRERGSTTAGEHAFWHKLYRRINMPWTQIGCDDRIGVAEPRPAQYTVFDHLFYRETTADLIEASQGLTAKIRSDIGVLGATLFQFGAFTPLRDLVINSRRKDPADRGNYDWAPEGEGLTIGFWDNDRFSDWIKGVWSGRPAAPRVKKVREGRFHGIEIDAMSTPRQTERFFERADEILEQRRRLEAQGAVPASCEAAFALGLQ